jgi:hypothetical protein
MLFNSSRPVFDGTNLQLINLTRASKAGSPHVVPGNQTVRLAQSSKLEWPAQAARTGTVGDGFLGILNEDDHH